MSTSINKNKNSERSNWSSGLLTLLSIGNVFSAYYAFSLGMRGIAVGLGCVGSTEAAAAIIPNRQFRRNTAATIALLNTGFLITVGMFGYGDPRLRATSGLISCSIEALILLTISLRS